MYAIFAQIARFLSAAPAVAAPAGVARKLMESAGARAGLNPLQAQELRQAACAYLRVVR